MPRYLTEPNTGLMFLVEDDGTVSKICTDIDDGGEPREIEG